MKPSSLLPSLLRTVVPILAGLVITAAARIGINLDSATVAMYVTAAAIAAYYTAFRLVEAYAKRIGNRTLRALAGIFLGYAAPPEYPPTDASSLPTSAPRGI